MAARRLVALLAAVTLVGLAPPALAQSATLDKVGHAVLPGNRVQVEMTLSAPVEEPLSFATDNPARVALDFRDVGLNLARRTENIGVGMARSVTAVEASGRTRVVLNLVKLVPYEVEVDGRIVRVTLQGAGVTGSAAFAASEAAAAAGAHGTVENVDFRRGENGEGRVMVTLSDPSIVVDTRQEGDRIVVEFLNAELPAQLERRLDVIDFATPVKLVDTKQIGRNVRLTIDAGGLYEHLAYQSNDLYTLDVKPITPEEEEEQKRQKLGFTGERLSLNFQNIEVRAVLQLIADFTGLNLVASDTVGGNVTLRLKNVPWDQAMDIILKTKGLAMRQDGNVILVAPSEEIAAREKLELEAQQQIEELAPLRSEFIQVNYAKANTIASLLKSEGNSLMTDRGNVTVDERTNTLLVRDTGDAIDGIRKLVVRLDVPVRQVLIESRIVVADDTFNRELGVKFGLSRRTTAPGSDSGRQMVLGGKLDGDTNFGGNVAFNSAGAEDFMVSLPIANPAGSLGFALVGIPNFLLQLELQAMQREGRGEVLSNPRVITSNQKEALIEQGTEIPFQEASSSGATSTSFKKAVLSLRVTPQITPDDRILMDLQVNQDEVGEESTAGVPSVNTRAVTTQVLVDNGDTVVLGGIFEQLKRQTEEKVPFFGNLPWVGFLFRTNDIRDERRELLIFVTPKILKESLSSSG
jgi:type IV pilus assembly protein PilQ